MKLVLLYGGLVSEAGVAVWGEGLVSEAGVAVWGG